VSIRIGFQCQPQHADFAGMVKAWRGAEELGVDTIYSWDHFYPLYGEPDGKHFEGIAALTALAASTERVKVGSLVFCNSYRNPQLLANAHSSIDNFSGGRVIFGIGAGWFERDYDEYGYEFGTAPDRLRALGRDLPLMKERLAKLNPGPIGPLPFLIGGAGEKVTLKLVAQHAQMWHTFVNDLDTYRHKTEVLAEHCANTGRDPSTIEHVIGSLENVFEIADDLADAGVAEITIGVGGPDYDLGKLREAIQWRDRYNARQP
jgi:probable F420-dependent oxidoreductase